MPRRAKVVDVLAVRLVKQGTETTRFRTGSPLHLCQYVYMQASMIIPQTRPSPRERPLHFRSVLLPQIGGTILLHIPRSKSSLLAQPVFDFLPLEGRLAHA